MGTVPLEAEIHVTKSCPFPPASYVLLVCSYCRSSYFTSTPRPHPPPPTPEHLLPHICPTRIQKNNIPTTQIFRLIHRLNIINLRNTIFRLKFQHMQFMYEEYWISMRRQTCYITFTVMRDSRDMWGLFLWNENGIKDGEPGWKQSFSERNMSWRPIFIFIQIKYKCKCRSNVYNQRRVWHHKLFKNDSCSCTSPLPLHGRSSAALSNFIKFTSG